MMMTPVSGPSDKLAQITSTLFLNTAQAAAVKGDPSVMLTIHEDIEEYHRELKLIVNLRMNLKLSILIILTTPDVLFPLRMTSRPPIKQSKFYKDS
jgi:hypothetical protein